MRINRTRIALSLALLLLGGCGDSPEMMPEGLRALLGPPATAETATAPHTTSATQPEAAASAANHALHPVVEVKPSPGLAKLRDLNPSQLVALYGEPDFRRAEPPAELWQYRSAECVLDLFLYADGREVHVVHADGRERNLRADPTRCSDGSEVLRKRLRDGKS